MQLASVLYVVVKNRTSRLFQQPPWQMVLVRWLRKRRMDLFGSSLNCNRQNFYLQLYHTLGRKPLIVWLKNRPEIIISTFVALFHAQTQTIGLFNLAIGKQRIRAFDYREPSIYNIENRKIADHGRKLWNGYFWTGRCLRCSSFWWDSMSCRNRCMRPWALS